MPTPTGLLKAGEKLRHIETGTIATVVRRNGNDPDGYTVWIEIGQRKHLLEMPFWLTTGHWELADQPTTDDTQLRLRWIAEAAEQIKERWTRGNLPDHKIVEGLDRIIELARGK
jgi:hypothetical protein